MYVDAGTQLHVCAVCTTLCVYVLRHRYTAGCCQEIVPPSLSYPGSYVHVMDAAPFLHHSQPMDGHMTSDPMSPPPEGEGLRTSLVSQLEYYFSKENLSSDKYLCEYHFLLIVGGCGFGLLGSVIDSVAVVVRLWLSYCGSV